MKLHIGDLVQIKKPLPDYMNSFHAGEYAVIENEDRGCYGLKFLGKGYSAWYESNNLILIAPGNRETFESHCAKMFKLVQF